MSGVLRGGITKAWPAVKSNVTQKATLMSGPPKIPIPFPEKVAIGVAMSIVVVTPAAWILSNIQEYKKRD